MHLLSNQVVRSPTARVGHNFVQRRSSRQSVEKHKAMIRLKRSYLPEKPSARKTLPALETPVSLIDPKTGNYKTSITVDILGTETFPQLTDWRKTQLIRKTRRLLPLPVSLTGLGDGQMPRFWTQVMKKSLFKFDRQKRWSQLSLYEKMPVSLRTYFDNFEDRVRTQCPQLYDSYLKSKLAESQTEQSSEQKTELSHQFPYQLVSHIKTRQKSLQTEESPKTDEVTNDDNSRPRLPSGTIDNEYDNYLKHHHLVQHLAASFKGLKTDEYEGEIEGWTNEFWRRSVL